MDGATIGTLWYWIVAVILTTYVVLDGFDLGVGALHLLLTRSDEERRITLCSVAPV